MNHNQKIENLFQAIEDKKEDLINDLDRDNADQVLGIDLEDSYVQMLDDVYDEVEIGSFSSYASTVLKEMDPDFYNIGLSEHLHFMIDDCNRDLKGLSNDFENSLFNELFDIKEDLKIIERDIEELEEELEDSSCKLKDCEDDGDQDGVETYKEEIETLKESLQEEIEKLEDIEEILKNV